MPKLPRIAGKDAIRAFEKTGYQVVRQRGSHIRMKSDQPDRLPITVPNHNLGPGLMRKLLRDTKLTVDEFIELLK